MTPFFYVLAAIIDGCFVALAAKRIDTETRQRVEDEFMDSVSEYHNAGHYRIPAEFVVVVGNKPASVELT